MSRKWNLGGIRLSDVMMNPELKKWISRDEYGDLRWREHGRTYLADLTNEGYLKERLSNVEAAIDAGVDEIYYDYAIGGTGEVVEFMSKIRNLIRKKGKNLTIYGNCKGDILADDLCDLTKSEGTEEAGVFDGEWVHNVTQSRFYYAAGDGWKPYRSKGGISWKTSLSHELKSGWKRPIAEANAFQAHYAVSEYGKLIQHWILKDNKWAIDVWKDICQYNEFLEENEEFYTDVTTVSKVGILAPPDYRWEREFFNTLGEMNLMYDVLLLPRIDTNTLAKYKTIVIPDIPYVNERQLKVIEDYKKGGGKIYTIGSSEDLEGLATIYSPPSMCQEIEKEAIRKEFLDNLRKLSGEPLITLKGAKYVIANVVKKKGTDRIILHFVNYSKPVENIMVKVNLKEFVSKINKESILLLSPDYVSKEVKDVSVKGKKVEFTIPKLGIYNVVVIN